MDVNSENNCIVDVFKNMNKTAGFALSYCCVSTAAAGSSASAAAARCCCSLLPFAPLDKTVASRNSDSCFGYYTIG